MSEPPDLSLMIPVSMQLPFVDVRLGRAMGMCVRERVDGLIDGNKKE